SPEIRPPRHLRHAIDPNQGGEYRARHTRYQPSVLCNPGVSNVTASNAKAPAFGASFQMSIPADGAIAPDGAQRTYNIAAVDRALDLLEALARIGPATLAALAEDAGMTRTAGFRLLRTMQARGFAIQDRARGLWRLGARWGMLSRAAASQGALGATATRVDPGWIAADLERIRSRGWLITTDEMFAGACAIATPVRDAGGDVVAAIVIASPSLRMRPPRPRSLLAPTLAAATQMSEALGAPGSARSAPAVPTRRIHRLRPNAQVETRADGDAAGDGDAAAALANGDRHAASIGHANGDGHAVAAALANGGDLAAQ